MNDTEKCKLKNEKLNYEKTYNIPSRAYVRARIYRSFYFFAVTSVTAFWVKRCFIACYVASCTEFNNRVIRGIENQWKREGKARFSGLRFWGFPLFFSLIYLVFHPPKYSKGDTCDSKKSTSLLEGARATRTHEKNKWDYFVRLRLRFLCIDKIKCHFFAIFSLFEGVSTHIHIGVPPQSTPLIMILLSRRKPT